MAFWTERSTIYASRLVPINALVLTGLATFRLVADPHITILPNDKFRGISRLALPLLLYAFRKENNRTLAALKRYFEEQPRLIG